LTPRGRSYNNGNYEPTKEVYLKEIKIRTAIAEHDFQVKLKHIKRLLNKDKVMVSIFFRGREIVHSDRGTDIINRVIEETKDIARVEARFEKERRFFIILVNDAGRTN